MQNLFVLKETWGRIQYRKISLRCLSTILRVLRFEVSLYNVYIPNQFQPTFAGGGGGGIKTVGAGAVCLTSEKYLKIFAQYKH